MITKDDITKYFRVGEEILSGGERTRFKITEILEDRIRIQPTEAKTASRLGYDKLTAVVENFDRLDRHKIERSVLELLLEHGLKDTQNESYLYGFARAYLQKSQQQTMMQLQTQLEEDVEKSRKLSPEQRKRRLKGAPKKPEQVTVTSKAFKRNPDVIAEALERADGLCGSCKRPAPFKKAKDGSPYLEVHHVKPLSEGGYDTVKNAIALCPNCHRKSHHG